MKCRQHQQLNAESAARQWSVSDSDLVLPEYIIHFSYVSQVSMLCSSVSAILTAAAAYTSPQLNSKDIFEIMLLEQSPLPDGSEFIQAQPHLEGEEELSPPTPGHPRLAMLDAATVLQITSQPNLSSVKASIHTVTCEFDLCKLSENHKFTFLAHYSLMCLNTKCMKY